MNYVWSTTNYQLGDCHYCGGHGVINGDECPACNGYGSK